MPEPTQPPRVFEIDCPNCGERLTTRADNAGKRIHCPICNDQLTVTVRTSERLPDDLALTIEPPRTFAPRAKAPPEIPPDDSFLDAGSSNVPFSLEDPSHELPPPSPFSPLASTRDGESDDDDTYALAPRQVLPPTPPPTAYLRARAEVESEEAARRAEEEKFRPRRAAASPGTNPPPPPPRRDAAEEGDYGVEPVAPPSAVMAEEPAAYRRAKESLERQEEEMPQALSEPPPWPFINGVLTYPWTRDLLLAWGVAAAGALVVGGAFQLGLAMMSGGLLMIVTVFCFVVVASAGLLTLTYLATYGLAIVENSAAGLDELAAAPDTTLVERFKPTAFVTFVAWVATLPGFAFGYLVLGTLFGGGAGMVVVPTMLVAFFLFPVLLLSTLESDSIVQLLAPRVVRSLRNNWRLWLRFYAASGALLLLGLGLAAGLFLIPFAGPFLAAPLLAAAPLIYARMIGRLSWLAAYEADRSAASRRKAQRGA
jgi:hypothetical protein